MQPSITKLLSLAFKIFIYHIHTYLFDLLLYKTQKQNLENILNIVDIVTDPFKRSKIHIQRLFCDIALVSFLHNFRHTARTYSHAWITIVCLCSPDHFYLLKYLIKTHHFLFPFPPSNPSQICLPLAPMFSSLFLLKLTTSF